MPSHHAVAAGMGLALILAAISVRAEPPAVDFGRDVLPILSENCLLCHGPDAGTRKADLRLDVRESLLRAEAPLVVPGKAAESELIRRLTTDDPEERMPPPKSGKVLGPEQVATLSRWIDGGAPWGRHWAFEPPRLVEPPAVAREDRVRNPIDRFILERLQREGLEPAGEADRITLIRRATLDLTGLPPSPREVDDFLADGSPDAYERVVDRLLASPRYGEAMASDWLDAARYADTNGYQNDFARTMWPWRDWVIGAFNADMPFDRFTIEQIAGDLLPNPTVAQKVATGFNRNNRTVTEAGSIDEEWRIENAVDRVETTATTFLGLTMGCARCHDHKYDPITQREFYEFLGFFNNINEKGVYTEKRGNVPPLIAVPTQAQEDHRRELETRLAATESAAKRAEAGLPGRQASWEATIREQAPPEEPKGWDLRIPLADLNARGPGDVASPVTFHGEGSPVWVDGPYTRALAFDGKPSTLIEAGAIPPLDGGGPYTIAFWVRPLGDGACLSKMDEASAFRGLDVCVSGGRVETHLIHSWPKDALKVQSKVLLPRVAWSHVAVTYDGSGRAAGLKLSIDGRPAEVEVVADALRGETVVDQPLRIGRRTTGLPFRGELADVRLARRVASPEEIRGLHERPALVAAHVAGGDRTAVVRALLDRHFRRYVDVDLAMLDDRLASIRAKKAAYEQTIPTVMIMEDAAEARPLYLLNRGQYDQPDKTKPLTAGVPSCLPSLPKGADPNRLALARWLASPEHPLTARVATNRAWQRHFGEGLLKSSENLGLQADPPSHPALLDWLATEMIRNGWSLKRLHRLIVTSATYRQASQASPDLLRRDPENRLLARGPRFRLTAEGVRDNALAISGLLSSKIGGPPVKPYQPPGLWEELAGGAGEGPYVQDEGEALYRRSLYVYRKRTVPHPAMSTFDAPSREICQVKRARTNTPLQALELLNDVVYVEAARNLAMLMLTEGGPTPGDRVAFAFRRATGRTPTAAELEILLSGLARRRETFLASPESAGALLREGRAPAPPGVDPSELAAYAATASVILNLDETITLE